MTEQMSTTAPPYDITLASILPMDTYWRFVGEAELYILVDPKNVGEVMTFDIYLFPYIVNDAGYPEASGKPRLGKYTGRLVSVEMTHKDSRGKFYFEDGTYLYFCQQLLN